MSNHLRLTAPPVLAMALAIAIAACSSAAAPSTPPTGGPSLVASAIPSGAPAPGAVDHKTGAADVLLRYEEGGAHMMAAFLVAQVPHFTLYGDGIVIFRNPALEVPAGEGSVSTFNPMRTATLSEEQIQELLVLALGEGGLAVARPNYENNMVADASTAMFTIEAGGIKKTVSIYALGHDDEGVPDAPARAAFSKLAAHLTDFDRGGVFATDFYEPTEYRGVLIENPGVEAADMRDWRWPDLTVADFKPDADPNGLQFPHRVMTTAEIDKLDVKDYQGGFQGLVLKGSDGKIYTMGLRPLLPDDNG